MQDRLQPLAVTVTLPGPTLGVVGGGQLGRMLAEAAAPLGVEVIVLDPTPDCPAAPVARDQIVADFDDPDGVRQLADRADVLTFEIELADPDLLDAVSEETGVPIQPDPSTLRTIQDKLVQKETLATAGIPVPEFEAVEDAGDVRRTVERHDGVMLKAREGGYDGRGNLPVATVDAAEPALDSVGGDAMAEEFLDFERELAVIGVKGDGAVRTYPTTETIHREEILRETVTPARASEAVRERAQAVARDVLAELDGRGVYGIELFETREGEVLVNEIAPRPHNSGHWTIEGATCSQFENHVRATLGWPLGETTRRCPTAIANLLGDVEESTVATLSGVDPVLSAPNAHLHWYGKREVRPLRKMGHLTVTGRSPDEEGGADVLERARRLRDGLTFKQGTVEDRSVEEQ
ncbi:Phosphoribosylaminoimidazole carboxylase (NCAIR synthetase) [Halalkaliarchaeum sp. AArc-CO]|nr:Phosphoribosylaminoimidazole carboxylase (NCAIR synthetase) [Halalkaliarchaeum sp. AArc-CO]